MRYYNKTYVIYVQIYIYRPLVWTEWMLGHSKTTQYPAAQSADIINTMWSVFWALVITHYSSTQSLSQLFPVCLRLGSLPGSCHHLTTLTDWKSSSRSEELQTSAGRNWSITELNQQRKTSLRSRFPAHYWGQQWSNQGKSNYLSLSSYVDV